MTDLLRAATLAPSVGLSEPWRFVLVEDRQYRVRMRQNFLTANHEALAGYEGERARLYASLKLEGLDQAPKLAEVGWKQRRDLSEVVFRRLTVPQYHNQLFLSRRKDTRIFH